MRETRSLDSSAVAGAVVIPDNSSQPDLLLATKEDLDNIWRWNTSTPRPVEGLVHDLVAKIAHEQPDAPAVDAWDGRFTYSQLDAFAGKLASVLSLQGVTKDAIVAIYLKKSRWMPIAMLGIIKCGAAAVVLDTNQPLARLESILDQSAATTILTSPELRSHVPKSGRCQVLELDDTLLGSIHLSHIHRAVPISQTVYISFTSGTTGSPKGACMSHANVRSAVHYQGSSLGFQNLSRVLDFVPYSFDVAWSNFFHTICAGGCLCIAEEVEMLQDLAAVISSYRCTLINITPTVLRTLKPGLWYLETILLSGEPPYRDNILQWADRVRLLNTYGPTECTFKSAFSVIGLDAERPTIGTGVGTCTWLVDPADHTRLVSVGETGELVIEGPLVGKGYLVNQEATAAAFIEDPPWLLQSHGAHPGRRGRIYKTGDLAKYRPDGQLVFVGRKDTAQVKIRGQRVEVADVEYHVRKLLPQTLAALVDVVYPKGAQALTLAVFIETARCEEQEIKKRLDDLNRRLEDVLPAFMLPTLYYPVHQIPLGPTGKADRRALRELTCNLTMAELLEAQSHVLARAVHQEPENSVESKLRGIWADILGLPSSRISTNDNFFRLGGDSVKAIRLIAAARMQNLSVSISDVFQAATLREFASTAQSSIPSACSLEYQPFSLLGAELDRSNICQAVAALLRIETHIIEDILPCTPMQEGMMAMTSMRSDDYVLRKSYRLPRDIDLDALEHAWAKILDSAPILRTRITPLPHGHLAQVVIRAKYCSKRFLDRQSKHESASTMGLGTPLFRAGISLDQEGCYNLNLQMHHAIFDGWSQSLIFEAVEQAYDRTQPSPCLASFQPFVRHVLEQVRQPQAANYWAAQLKDRDIVPFPRVSKTKGHKEELHLTFTGIKWPRTGRTASTLIRAALALLLSKYTNSDDIVFGATVSGRQAPVSDIDKIAGPTIATVSVSLTVSWEETLQNLQLRIQNQMIEMYEYEQLGLRNIAQAAGLSDVGESGIFQLLLVVQHESGPSSKSGSSGLFSQPLGSATGRSADTLSPFNSHGMMIVCNPTDSGLELDLSFDVASISSTECETFARHLEHVLRLMCCPAQQTLKLENLVFASESDVQQVLHWNNTSVPSVNESAIDMIRAQVSSHPYALAVECPDFRLTYQDLWGLSSKLEQSLLGYNIQDCRIPLCFDKSPWMVITILAVLRAGGVAVPTSCSISEERALHVASACNSKIAITAREWRNSCPFSAINSLLVIEDLLEHRSSATEVELLDKNLTLSDPAVVVFTSGTTNSSKGVLWSHRTLSSNIQAAIESFRMSKNSRVFQFAAYDFDVSTIESLAVLSAGGCLCIPEQQDLLNRLSGAICDAKANWICLTPSVADTLDWKQLASLQIIVFAGEKLKPANARPWVDSGALVFNWYGPAEAPVATCCSLEHSEWQIGLIGKSKSGHTWIIDLRDPARLAPVGVMGELCIEGDIVADGYIGMEGRPVHHVAFTPPPAVSEAMSSSPIQNRAVFRTGDHAKYDADGNIVFLGRSSNSWTKMHGRRIDLHVIEEAAQTFSEDQPNNASVSDVMTLADTESECLVLFIYKGAHTPNQNPLAINREYEGEELLRFRHHLSQQLPAYMIPKYLIPVSRLPLGKTGKIDRQALRRFGSNLSCTDLVTLVQPQGYDHHIDSPNGKILQRLWATVLGIGSGQVSLDSHFFRLGGDSITAMRLVSLLRENGLRLATAQVFQNPILGDMASVVIASDKKTLETPAPFSLVNSKISTKDAIAAAARLCKTSTAKIVDICPCTALQQELLALTARNPGQYVSRSVLELQVDIDISRFRDAWLATVADLPILRTRLADLPGSGLMQVVVKDLNIEDASNVEEYVGLDEQRPMFLGDALCRTALVGRSFVLTIHHSIYDGAFLSMLLSRVEEKYFAKADTSIMPFNTFVRHILQALEHKATEFWAETLGNAEYQMFPQLPTVTYVPQATEEVKQSITLEWPRDGETPTIIVRSAWALVAARFSMSTNVIFGTVLSGRQIDLPGVEHCAGPTVCTIPISVRVDWSEEVDAFHARLRKQDLDTLPYQHHGIHNIARAAGKTKAADLFQTLFVVHPIITSKSLQTDNAIFKARTFGATLDTIGADPFNAHALMVSCWLGADGLQLAMSFDDSILTRIQVETLVQHFEQNLRQITGSTSRQLGQISQVNPEELHRFWSQRASSRTDDEQTGVHTGQIASFADTTGARHLPERHDSGPSTMPIDRLRQQAASLCDVPEHEIEDLYPCTPLQESLTALSERRSGDYVGHDNLPLASHVDIDRFREAWEKVVLAAPILRTRIIDIAGEGLMQAVICSSSQWSAANTFTEFALEEQQTTMSLGRPLIRFGLVRNGYKHNFLLTMHHAVYDGMTNVLIREILESYYDHSVPTQLLPFRNFVDHITTCNVDSEQEFWMSQFQDLKVQQFPTLPSPAYQPQPDSLTTRSVDSAVWRTDGILPSTIIRAAWAVVCSYHSSSPDVVFGTIVSGRQAAVANIDRLCGPTIAALPVRIRADPSMEVGKLLELVQTQAVEMIPFEQSGIARIASSSEEAREACKFQSMLVIQPEQTMSVVDSHLFDSSDQRHQELSSYHTFNSHALMAICVLNGGGLDVQLSVDSSVMDADKTMLFVDHFAEVIRELCRADWKTRLCEIKMITDREVDQIWRWNQEVLPSEGVLVHQIIDIIAQQQPNSVAVSAWDGELTYGQLSSITTSIAVDILGTGISGNQIVPICFEKSLWTTAAFFGVVKAGHAVLMLEPTLPEVRLQEIIRQAQPSMVLSSAQNRDLCIRLCDRVLVVDADTTRDATLRQAAQFQLPRVKLTDILYVIFTSGSTGSPKGCMISHGNISSAIVRQKGYHQINNTSRVYDFSSYSFDAHHWVLLHTLCAGGTLCVPSETQRRDQLESSLRLYQITDLLITPATAKMINPATIPTLQNAIIVGDRMSKEELSPWAVQVKVTYAYGPSECSAWATSWEVPYPVPEIIPIGKGAGQVTWVVDPTNIDRLSPVGTVGELCLEGPLVGQGYLNNEEATRTSFLDSPIWLAKTSSGTPGRHGSVYRTGDLVKYDPTNGNIIFVGRKDCQVKLHGKRLELGDVEQQVLKCLVTRGISPLLAAELVVPDTISRSVIVVFLQMSESQWNKLESCLREIREELAERVPSHMVPSAYKALESMPVNTSGKINRTKLKEIGKCLESSDFTLTEGKSSIIPPATDLERKLQQMWAQVLHISTDTVGRNSNFFRVSGDSITAMQLMALSRRKGFSLPVSEILANPCLEYMAKAMQQLASETRIPTVKPFSLLNHPGKADDLRREVARQCGVHVEIVEDCYPCTAVQKSLLAITSKRPGDYIARIPIELAENADLPKLRKAWEDVSTTTAPILRNRVLALDGEGFVQAQLRVPLEWTQHSSIETFLEDDESRPIGLTTALTRLALVDADPSGKRLCILTQHHAIYDGVSISLLLGAVGDAYNGTDKGIQPCPFQNFMQYTLGVSKGKSKNFWRQQFAECNTTAYPLLPSEHYQPQADSTTCHDILDIRWPNIDVTPAIVVQAAWAMLSAVYTDSKDVVFGVLSTGRQAPVDGIENIIAPLIAAVPVRIQLEPTRTMHQLLTAMQKQSIDMTPYEQTSMTDIQASSENAILGAKFNTLLIIQHSEQAAALSFEGRPFVRMSHSLHDGRLDRFNPHAAMLMFQMHGSGKLRMELNYDASVISSSQTEILVNHFEQALRQICASTAEQKIKDMSLLSDRDLERLRKWNSRPPAVISACVHDLFVTTAFQYPNSQALCSWDGDLTYVELNNLSSSLAKQLVTRGVKPGNVIPLCFDKSMWMPVAALGAIKAGAACVSVDCTQPEGRLRTILGKIQPEFILTSPANEAMARRLCVADVILVERDRLASNRSEATELPKVSPSDLLYVVFTSGSTGEPKGVTTTHQNFTSAMTHQRDELRVYPGTRVFDFVSYSFDVAWSNLLNTLLCGATLCIPSEAERKNDIPAAFNRMKANYSYFTPTVARSLDPLTLPALKTLAMGGEPIPVAELARWRQVETFIGIYGPAECAQALCITELTSKSPPGYVGTSFGARTWLVEPGRVDCLAPIGSVGELVIDGPAVATGYWNNLEMTAATFLKSPAWLSQFSGNSGYIYKSGDLLRYNDDGSLTFLGRKDQMVKLRGQRVELSEVEHNVLKALQKHTTLCDSVAAEVITPSGSKAPILAVFLALKQDLASHERLDRTFRLSRALEDVEEDIREALPQFMIPGAYITLDEMPMTTTNKIDRRALRHIGGQRKLEDLARMQFDSKAAQKGPNTDMERRIQQLWSQILGIDASSIKSHSSFLRIGGESISAMRLVAVARQAGIAFTVADVFRSPRLSQLAEVAKEIATQADTPKLEPRKPFSLLPETADDHMSFLYDTVEPLLSGDVETDDIQDMLPVTDFQELAVRENLQDPPGRLPHFTFDLPRDVDVVRLRRACKRLSEHFEILRSVFIMLDDKIWQVMLSHLKPHFEVVKAGDEEIDKSVKQICEKDLKRGRKLGESFVAFMAVTSDKEQSKLIFRLSHAQFDDDSLVAMFKTLTALYLGERVPTSKTGFGDLISYNSRRKAASLQYWKTRLSECPSPLTTLPNSTNLANSDRLSFTFKIPLPKPNDSIPLATIFHAACAIVLSHSRDCKDIIFGRLVTGRSMLPSELQNVVGPCLLEQPIRYQAQHDDNLMKVASKMQRQFIEDSSYEVAGMREIIQQSTDWGEGHEDFGWRTAFQQAGSDDGMMEFLGKDKVKTRVFEREQLVRRRPEVYAQPRGQSLEFTFEGNKVVLGKEDARIVVRDIAELIKGYY